MKFVLLVTLPAIAVLAFAAPAAHAESVTFVSSDMEPAFSVDTATRQVTLINRAGSAIDMFERLHEDDPLPGDLSFMAREAALRYAVLDLEPPGQWTARYVREVFRTRQDLALFMERHFSGTP